VETSKLNSPASSSRQAIDHVVTGRRRRWTELVAIQSMLSAPTPSRRPSHQDEHDLRPGL